MLANCSNGAQGGDFTARRGIREQARSYRVVFSASVAGVAWMERSLRSAIQVSSADCAHFLFSFSPTRRLIAQGLRQIGNLTIVVLQHHTLLSYCHYDMIENDRLSATQAEVAQILPFATNRPNRSLQKIAPHGVLPAFLSNLGRENSTRFRSRSTGTHLSTQVLSGSGNKRPVDKSLLNHRSWCHHRRR